MTVENKNGEFSSGLRCVLVPEVHCMRAVLCVRAFTLRCVCACTMYHVQYYVCMRVVTLPSDLL